MSASKQSQEQTVDISSRRFTSVKDKTANSSRVFSFRYDELRKSFQGGMIPREPVQSLLRREETFHENSSFSRSLYYYYRCYDGRINLTTDCTSFLRWSQWIGETALQKLYYSFFSSYFSLCLCLLLSIFAKRNIVFSRWRDIDGEKRKASGWKLSPVKRATRPLTPRILKDPAYLRRNDKSEGNFNPRESWCSLRFARSKWLGHEMANYYYYYWTRYPPSFTAEGKKPRL